MHIAGFQLVIICAKEREDKSTIVTAFERFRVDTPVLHSTNDIQRYLEQHFSNKDATLVVQPASELDATK